MLARNNEIPRVRTLHGVILFISAERRLAFPFETLSMTIGKWGRNGNEKIYFVNVCYRECVVMVMTLSTCVTVSEYLRENVRVK